MNKTTCELVNDLLPLYADNVCSEDSRTIVAEHITNCENCRGQLEKMTRNLDVDPDSDIAVIKRIQKRIRIERMVITIAILIFMFFAGLLITTFLFTTDAPMSYYENDLDRNVWVEERENGDLFMVRIDEACNCWFVFPNVYDSQWRSINDEGFDRFDAKYHTYALRQRTSDKFNNVTMTQKEYTLLFNIHQRENIDAVYYHDEINDEKHLLWERK